MTILNVRSKSSIKPIIFPESQYKPISFIMTFNVYIEMYIPMESQEICNGIHQSASWSILFVKKPASQPLILCLLVPSADNHCKQFGPRSGPT